MQKKIFHSILMNWPTQHRRRCHR